MTDKICIADVAADTDFAAVGRSMHTRAADLYPICRSITGDGVRERSELATDDGQQSGPVDIGSGEEGADSSVGGGGGGGEVVEHLEVEEEEGFDDDTAL